MFVLSSVLFLREPIRGFQEETHTIKKKLFIDANQAKLAVIYRNPRIKGRVLTN